MRASLVLVLVFALAGCGAAAAPPAATVREPGCRPAEDAASFGAGSVRVCPVGEDRRYALYEPRALGREPVPLIVALHGVGGPQATPAGTAQASRLGALADAESVAVAYADGNGTWSHADDAYFSALFDDVARHRAIDPRRVYVIGWSGGGFMVHRIACRLADRVAAVAVLQAPLRGDCRPSAPVSVLQIVGEADPVIPVAGGTLPDGTRAPKLTTAMARWRRLAACDRPTIRSDEGIFNQLADCDGGASVDLIALEGGGHVWYGPDQPAPDNKVDATQEAWRFFAAHPKARGQRTTSDVGGATER
ncbi:polyhydroxybutyrate depolymerase [Solirubrobacter pauli]|uniref:Polyhydroxybutyrate depolymerase n=1 Tax=Solirubrobacter pauli TaxID=166793 RepID=A0A660KWI1_9ACTN|nr:PHB depolymerase family esterase [Solirubrobacter pauli]RKQ84812.1 polyhydroxybutyrate depolymerase [Solirubrobacter pauli]